MTRGATDLTSVQRIYDAALTPDAWQPALQSVVDLIGGDHAILVARDPAHDDPIVATCAGMDDSDFSRFLSPHALRLMAPFTRALPSGVAIVWSHLARDQEFERTEFYNEVVRPARGFYAVAFRQETPTLSSFVAVCRSRRRADFTAADATKMQRLAPHLANALRVRQRLHAADLSAAGAWATLEHLRTGVMIVDAAGSLVFANKAAATLSRDGGLEFDRDGPRAPDATACCELRRLIAGCVAAEPREGNGNAVKLPRNDGRSPLRVVGAPLHPERIGMHVDQRVRPLALLLVTDPEEERSTRKERLRIRFGLTSAEADLAIEIGRGDGRKAAACRLGVTVATVRTHLTHIFEKTGAHCQAELVRLVLQTGDER